MYNFSIVVIVLTLIVTLLVHNLDDKEPALTEGLRVSYESHVLVHNNSRPELNTNLEGSSSSKQSYKTTFHNQSSNDANIQGRANIVNAKTSNSKDAKGASLKEEEVILGSSLSLIELNIAGQKNKIIYDSFNSTHQEKILGTDITRSQLDLDSHYNATVYKVMKSNIHSIVLGSDYSKLEINLISKKNLKLIDKSKSETESYILGVNFTVEELNNSYITKE